MFSVDDILATRSGKAFDSEGEKVGSVGEVYLDDQSGQPAWVTVNTGLFGTSESFVPLEGARTDGQDLHLPYTKAKIKDAPRQDADKHLDVEQEEALYRYYGLTDGERAGAADGRVSDGRATGDAARDGAFDGRGDAAMAGAAGTAGAAGGLAAGREGQRDAGADEHEGHFGGHREAGLDERDVNRSAADTTGRNAVADGPLAGRDVGMDHDVAGRDSDRGVVGGGADHGLGHDDDAMARPGTQRPESAKARLRKYVVTDQESAGAPTSQHQVDVRREPMNERAASGTQLGEETHSVPLHEERPVMGEEIVERERVDVERDDVAGTQRVQPGMAHETTRGHDDVERGVAGREGTFRDGEEEFRDGEGTGKRSLADRARDLKDDLKGRH